MLKLEPPVWQYLEAEPSEGNLGMGVESLWWDSCPYKKRKRPESILSLQREVTSRRQPSARPVPPAPNCLASRFWTSTASRVVRNKCLLFRPLSLYSSRGWPRPNWVNTKLQSSWVTDLDLSSDNSDAKSHISLYTMLFPYITGNMLSIFVLPTLSRAWQKMLAALLSYTLRASLSWAPAYPWRLSWQCLTTFCDLPSKNLWWSQQQLAKLAPFLQSHLGILK